MNDITLHFTAPLWVYSGGKATWHFITLPVEDAHHVKFFRSSCGRGGSVRVRARIGDTEWMTSLFPDKDTGSYMLPIKAEVRKNEDLSPGDVITVDLMFHADI